MHRIAITILALTFPWSAIAQGAKVITGVIAKATNANPSLMSALR